MAHRSESDYQLKTTKHFRNKVKNQGPGNVYVFHFPTDFDFHIKIDDDYFANHFFNIFNEVDENSIFIFLSNTMIALDFIPLLQSRLKYRLWIAVERESPIKRQGILPDNHVALTVFTKYVKPFKHSKIQIEYTNCPACGKTTKDYGGKKHLYSPYGTLMSDIWRDIKITEGNVPENILDRLSDLFAIEPYKNLHYYDYRTNSALFSSRASINLQVNGSHSASLESRLINDDCIKILSSLPDSSIDFAFADPPYNINKKYDNWNDSIQIEEYFSWCDNWIKEIYRVLKPGKIFCLINIPLWIVRHYMFAKDYFTYSDYIAWEGLGLPVRNIMPAHYGLLCLSKGKPNPVSNYDNRFNFNTIFNSSQSLKEWYCVRHSCVRARNRINNSDREPLTNLWWDIHRLKHNSKRVDHPCQLPPDLMKRLIYTFTKAGDIVLDPFNGAGTTTLVSELMERKYIGIELSEKYHSIALERHIAISNGIDPFRKQNNTPKSKNSRVKRLKKQYYKISKKTLQLEVRNIAHEIGKRPTREDVKKHTKYPFEYFEKYFIDWGEVCAAVGDKGMNENQCIEKSTNKIEHLTLFEL